MISTPCAILVSLVVFLSSTSLSHAHVTVKPASVGIGAYETFTLSAPVEKDIATTGLKLLIPDGLESITPNVKPGWTITLKKSGTGAAAKVTEIEWTNGNIPTGQRDVFLFAAKAPTSVSTLNWKAYQTYADGSIVAWDMDPTTDTSHETDDHEAGPYSITSVIDDLTSEPTMTPTRTTDQLSTRFSLLGLVVSFVALGVAVKRSR